MSPAVIPRVSRPPTTTVFSSRAEGGSSHSKVTPTRCWSRPRAYTISVADGSSETTRISPVCLLGRRRRPGAQAPQPLSHLVGAAADGRVQRGEVVVADPVQVGTLVEENLRG